MTTHFAIREHGVPPWDDPQAQRIFADLFIEWQQQRTDGGRAGGAVAVSTEDTAPVTLMTAQPA